MTIGGWWFMTLAFTLIGGLFGWCCWKMSVVSDDNDKSQFTNEKEVL